MLWQNLYLKKWKVPKFLYIFREKFVFFVYPAWVSPLCLASQPRFQIIMSQKAIREHDGKLLLKNWLLKHSGMLRSEERTNVLSVAFCCLSRDDVEYIGANSPTTRNRISRTSALGRGVRERVRQREGESTRREHGWLLHVAIPPPSSARLVCDGRQERNM